MDFGSSFGLLFENYVLDLLEYEFHQNRIIPTSISFYKNSEINFLKHKPNQKKVDFIISSISSNSITQDLFFFEIKSGLVNLSTGLFGDLKYYQKDIEDTIAEGFLQIVLNIYYFLNEECIVDNLSLTKNENYYPIILLYKSFPIYYPLWERYVRQIINNYTSKKLKEFGIVYDFEDLLNKLQILDINEFESILNLNAHGYRLADIIKNKIKDDIYFDAPMINYLDTVIAQKDRKILYHSPKNEKVNILKDQLKTFLQPYLGNNE